MLVGGRNAASTRLNQVITHNPIPFSPDQTAIDAAVGKTIRDNSVKGGAEFGVTLKDAGIRYGQLLPKVELWQLLERFFGRSGLRDLLGHRH